MAISGAAKSNYGRLLGDRASALAQSDPELAEYFGNFAFGEVHADAARLDETLDLHIRLMVQLAAILAAGGLAEFRVVGAAAVADGGVSPVELKEIVYQSVAYVGMARVSDYLHAANDVLAEAGVELPLPRQSASTPQTRLEHGKAVQARIIGDDAVAARLTDTPADEAHFQRYLAANCFGDTVGLGGIGLEVRELLTFAMLVALGGADAQVRGHVHGNLRVGNTRARLLAVLTVLLPFIGYPAPLTLSPRSTTSRQLKTDDEEHDMEYRLLGRTGVSVSPLCLGTMMFGPWGNDDRADAVRVIHRALDAGINFVDTADVYSGGVSEEITGEALQGRRDDVVLATKFFVPMDERPNHGGGSRKWIMQEAENSLRRLKTDYIDLYQVHRPSATTDVEETLGALTDLVRQGKVRYIGSSSYSASQIVEAQWVSRERNLARFVTEQPPYSILVRGIEEDVLPTVQRHGMGSLVYSPLSGGWLTGRWRKGAPGTPASAARPGARFDMSTPANQRKLDVVEEIALLAERSGMTMIELALAWAINHPGVTSAIIGPRTMEQLESQLPSVHVTLDTEILDRIDELVAPGVTLNPDDNSYGAAELTPQARRRQAPRTSMSPV